MLHADDVQNMGGLVFDELPKTRVSAMNNLFSAPYFILTLNEFTYGFQSISNIGRHREVTHYQEGGVNDRQILVGRPNDNVYTLELSRGYILHGPDSVTDKLLKSGITLIPNELMRKLALIAINSTSPQAALENGPSVGLIQAFSRRKKLIAMFSFLSLGMVEWRLSELNAMSGGEAMIESITLEHTGLTMLPTTWMPSIAQPIMSWLGETEDSMDTMAEIMRKNKEDFERRKKKTEELNKLKEELDAERLKLLQEHAKMMEKNRENEIQDIKTREEKRKDIESKRKESYEVRSETQKAISDAQSALDDKKVEGLMDNMNEVYKNQKDEVAQLEEREEERKKQQQDKKDEIANRGQAEADRQEKVKEQQAAEQAKRDEVEAKKQEELDKQKQAREQQQQANQADHDRRAEAQQGRVDKQNAQDTENVRKVHESTAKAEENMKNEQ